MSKRMRNAYLKPGPYRHRHSNKTQFSDQLCGNDGLTVRWSDPSIVIGDVGVFTTQVVVREPTAYHTSSSRVS